MSEEYHGFLGARWLDARSWRRPSLLKNTISLLNTQRYAAAYIPVYTNMSIHVSSLLFQYNH